MCNALSRTTLISTTDILCPDLSRLPVNAPAKGLWGQDELKADVPFMLAAVAARPEALPYAGEDLWRASHGA